MSAFTLFDRQHNESRTKYTDYIDIDGTDVSQSMSFMFYCTELLLKDLELSKIEEGIVDGFYRREKHDYGVDSIYLTANGSYIESKEEIIDYNEDSKFEVHIFQFKKSQNVELNDFIKFKDGVSRLFKDNDIIPEDNEYFYERMNTIKSILEEVYHKFSISQIKFHLYFVYKGIESNIENESIFLHHIEKTKQLLTELGYDNIFFHIIGVQKLIELSKKSDSIIEIIKYQKGFKYITDTNDNKKLNGYICMVKGDEIAKLVKQYQTKLFEANIREYYARNELNSKIIQTCTSEVEAKFFWSYNNGLTLTCNKVEDLPNDQYKLYGVQIVNGCQTSNALYTALKNKEKADRLLQKKENEPLSKKELAELDEINNKFLNKNTSVLIKIIETNDSDLIYSITEKTNSQTPIQTFSLKANESIQQNIEEYLKTYGIFYERRINFYKNQGKSNILSIQKLFQLYISQYLFKPSQAKSNPKKMFRSEYNKVFSEKENPKNNHYDLYYIAVIIDQKIHKKLLEFRKKKSEKDPYDYTLLSYCKLHIGPMILHSIVGNYDKSVVVKNNKKIIDAINSDDIFNSHFNNAFSNLRKIVQDYAGKKKENIPENVKRSELDEKIVKFIKSQKKLSFYIKS